MGKADTQLLQAMQDMDTALRQGDFARLADLTLQLQGASLDLRQLGGTDLQRLKRLAVQNERNLSAAQRGLRAARRRLAEVMSVARGFATYDRQGHRVERADPRQVAGRF